MSRRHDAMAYKVAQRRLEAAIKNDPSTLPMVGARVVKIDVNTTWDPMADIVFDDGSSLSAHLSMNPTNALDSTTEAWQEAEIARLQGDENGTVDGEKTEWTEEELTKSITARYLEAGASDLLQWMVQPAEILWKHHREFVSGPIDDAIDNIIKELSPRLTKGIVDEEVNEDTNLFEDGAIQGDWDRDHDILEGNNPRKSRAWQDGYDWGFDHPETVTHGKLSPYVRRGAVEKYLKAVRRRITEEAVKRALLKAWDAISPKAAFVAIWEGIKRHGWKLGLIYGLIKIAEDLLLPAAVAFITGQPGAMGLAAIPVAEIVVPIGLRIMGRVPKELDKLNPKGHLAWYEAQFGPIRIAALGT